MLLFELVLFILNFKLYPTFFRHLAAFHPVEALFAEVVADAEAVPAWDSGAGQTGVVAADVEVACLHYGPVVVGPAVVAADA